MPQIKIYGNASFLAQSRQVISDTIHACGVDALAFPLEKRFHRFIPLEPENFIYPSDRSEKYIIIEISMFEGRSVDAKKHLIRLLFSRLSEQVGIAANDVEITIAEIPQHNWGVRGKVGDELEVNGKIEV
ncbi:MAG: tautomerase family protein [Myxacorys chilensis ATA2-1-KO14]|jgi:phenylpyruvate tautomerase PptA (4-oxalocrotonate tautomerase family)|nr:tautomerase family protein [Myxacorys chilensis ATA2-1-KO14]